MPDDQTPKVFRQGIPFSIAEARALREDGMSWREAAEVLGTSVYLLKRVLADTTKGAVR